MVGILFLLSSFLLGVSILLYFPSFERIEEKFTLGLILGFILNTWITFLLSLILKSLNISLILGVTFISTLISIFLLKYPQRNKSPIIIKPSKTYLISLLTFTILLSIANLNTIKFDSQGNLVAMLHCWGDYASHLSYIFYLSNQIPLTLNNPLLVNHKLSYPFLIDFLSAVMYKGGLNYVISIILVNIILTISLISIIYLFAKEFTKSELCGLFALILFFLNGNFGFLFALGKDLKEIFFPTSFYSINHKTLFWGNTISCFFLPQRGFIWGMAISVSIYLILLKELFLSETISKSSLRNLFLSGIFLGSLPLIHTSSFLVLVFVSIIFFLYRIKKEWMYFLIPTIVFALPQILYLIKEHTLRTFRFQIGWEINSYNLLSILLFWIYNLGVIFFLILTGIFLTERKRLLFYLPFIFIFIIANLIVFHPWVWDNTKYFLHWFFLSCVIASCSLIRIKEISRWKKLDRIFLIIILIFFSIFSGLIDYLYLNQVSFVMADKTAQEIAHWVRRNIPPESLILTSDTHNHPVSMLSGRNIVLGYRGWLWSHGYNYGEIERDIQKIYQTADLELIKKYKITHIVISPYEKELRPNLRAFLNSKNFKEIYNKRIDSDLFRIFKVIY